MNKDMNIALFILFEGFLYYERFKSYLPAFFKMPVLPNKVELPDFKIKPWIEYVESPCLDIYCITDRGRKLLK